ncbi:hypothetical protein BXA50_17080, partial [Enterococcus faecium]
FIAPFLFTTKVYQSTVNPSYGCCKNIVKLCKNNVNVFRILYIIIKKAYEKHAFYAAHMFFY